MARRHPVQLNQPWDKTGFVRDAVAAAPHSKLDDWVVLDPWNTTLCFHQVLLNLHWSVGAALAFASNGSPAQACTCMYLALVPGTPYSYRKTCVSAAQTDPSTQCDATRRYQANPCPWRNFAQNKDCGVLCYSVQPGQTASRCWRARIARGRKLILVMPLDH